MSAFLIAASVLFVAVNATFAQSAHEAGIRFDIPPQPLEAALEAYGAASRLQVLYETAMTSGRRSTEVKGVFTQEAALRLLLSGTGLDFGYTEERAFTLVPARSQTRRIADFSRFLGAVQTEVMAALCRQPETRPGSFGLAMQFWIGGSGKFENASLLGSTGAASRDAVITDVLTRIALGEAPPADMPQPITMVLKSGPLAGGDECTRVRR